MNATYIANNKKAIFEIQDNFDEEVLLDYLKKFPEKILKNYGIDTKVFNGKTSRFLIAKVSLETFKDIKKFVENKRKIA